MPMTPVFLVILRRPRSDVDEMRSDPFWEFGSFGITGCHARNLMNLKKFKRLEGARLAFAQGGSLGTRLVYLTPPIKVTPHRNRVEATWTPHKMPFRYAEAPVLAHNRRVGDFPLLESTLKNGERRTLEGQFASNFRSRTTPLEAPIAKELIRLYSNMRKAASHVLIAAHYAEALPKLPPHIDNDRQRTYSSHLEAANTESLNPELATGYSANARRSRMLCKDLEPMDAKLPDCRTCVPKHQPSYR